MDIINTTPYAFHPLDASPAPSFPALTMIVKGAFKLRNGEAAEPLGEDEAPDFLGDDVFMDDIGRSLRYSSDLVPLKLRGEVLLNAVCQPDSGRARTAMDVSIHIGPIQKTLTVTGDRTWTDGANRAPTIGRTVPFEKMPIRWERAFGGLSYPANPLGRGIDAEPDEAGGPATTYLPNVEYPDKHVRDAKDRPPPAGFGPLNPMWKPRLERQGTRDARWAAFRAPLPPKDFDPRFYNAAPEDQQLPENTFFRGDETIVLKGLHKDVAAFETKLPGKRLRLFVQAREGIDDRGFFEVPMKLDTIFIDTEKEELTLLWRCPVLTKGTPDLEFDAVYIVEEDLAKEPRSLAEHGVDLARLRPPEKTGDATEEATEKSLAEARQVLQKNGADPKLIEALNSKNDPEHMFDRVMEAAEAKIKELQALTESFKSRTP